MINSIHKILLDSINLENNPKDSNRTCAFCYGWAIAPLKVIKKLNY